MFLPFIGSQVVSPPRWFLLSFCMSWSRKLHRNGPDRLWRLDFWWIHHNIPIQFNGRKYKPTHMTEGTVPPYRFLSLSCECESKKHLRVTPSFAKSPSNTHLIGLVYPLPWLNHHLNCSSRFHFLLVKKKEACSPQIVLYPTTHFA